MVAPDWLRSLAPAEWYERYGSRIENFDLPKTEAARRELAASIAADGLLFADVALGSGRARPRRG